MLMMCALASLHPQKQEHIRRNNKKQLKIRVTKHRLHHSTTEAGFQPAIRLKKHVELHDGRCNKLPRMVERNGNYTIIKMGNGCIKHGT